MRRGPGSGLQSVEKRILYLQGVGGQRECKR